MNLTLYMYILQRILLPGDSVDINNNALLPEKIHLANYDGGQIRLSRRRPDARDHEDTHAQLSEGCQRRSHSSREPRRNIRWYR